MIDSDFQAFCLKKITYQCFWPSQRPVRSISSRCKTNVSFWLPTITLKADILHIIYILYIFISLTKTFLTNRFFKSRRKVLKNLFHALNLFDLWVWEIIFLNLMGVSKSSIQGQDLAFIWHQKPMLIYENRHSKMKFFLVKEFFS